MKRSKLITIVIAAVLAVTAITVLALQAFGLNDGIFSSFFSRLKGAETTKTLTLYSRDFNGFAENGALLSYVESVTYDKGDRFDDYVDESGNTYRYDTDGHLIHFRGNAEQTSLLNATAENKIDPDGAMTVARAALQTLFGDITEGFEDSGCNLTDDGYSCSFVKKISFANAAYLFATVQTDGTVTFCTVSDYYRSYDKFDKSILDGVEESDVLSFADAELKAQYGDKMSGSELQYMALVKENGKYFVKASYVITTDTGDFTTADCYYPL